MGKLAILLTVECYTLLNAVIPVLRELITLPSFPHLTSLPLYSLLKEPNIFPQVCYLACLELFNCTMIGGATRRSDDPRVPSSYTPPDYRLFSFRLTKTM